MPTVNDRLPSQATIADAASRCLRWMLKHLDEERICSRDDIVDPASYYKWPLALAAQGERDRATELIAWMNSHCLQANGDYLSKRSGFHKEFHLYSTLWIVLAAIQLGDAELVEKLLGFIKTFHNQETGGVATFPAKSENITEDPVTTAFLGMAACEMKNQVLADVVLKYFHLLLERQDDAGKFHLRLSTGGSLIKSVPADAERNTYVIHLGQHDECYYFLGAACRFLGRYIETFNDVPLSLAVRYAELLEQSGNEALSTIWAAKVSPGCMTLYTATGDERYKRLAAPVMNAVLAGQQADGYWLKAGKPWVTVSAEQCFWLTDIASRENHGGDDRATTKGNK